MTNAPIISMSDTVLPHEIEIFPYVVVRVGGGSFDELAGLEVDSNGDLLTQVRAARNELDSARSILGEEIFGAIGGCTDANLRRALLGAKRDLFNDRHRPVQRLRELSAINLPSLSRYEGAAATFDHCWKTFEAQFIERQTEARRLLQKIAGNETFQKPLMLSSRTLLDELPAYLSAPPESPSAKQLHIERSVIKYVTRAHAKTSPFSTFGHIALAGLADLKDAVWHYDESLTFKSQVRISSSNWMKLQPLILAIRGIADNLRVRPNPTLETTEEGHKYLLSARNIEAFQTLPPIDELTRIAELAADSPAFTTLVNRVASADLVEGDENDVRSFLRRLIAEGFLEFDAGISGTDPDWDLHLMSLLRPMAAECPAAAEIIAALSDVREMLRLFATAGLADRDKILKESHARLTALRDLLMAAGDLQPQPKPADAAEAQTKNQRSAQVEQQYLLYEDSAISQTAIKINSPDLVPIVQSLATVVRYLSFADGLGDERLQLTHYCVAKYGERVVPLMRIYEDYYRDCKVPEHRRKKDSKAGTPEAAAAPEGPAPEAPAPEEPFDYPGAAAFGAASVARKRAIVGWSDTIVGRLRHSGRASAERVDIITDDLAAASARFPGLESVPFPGSAYVQLAAPDDRESHYLGVVNGIAPGHGKMMSRFLEMFPAEVTELNRADNRRAGGESRLAEVRDGSISNANMHPPLLDFEISSPGAQTSFPPEKQIPVSDLRVAVAASADIPLLLTRHSTGERVEVLDLGFLGLAFRAPLLQLLVHGFSRTKYPNYYPLRQAANVAASAGPVLPVQPRDVVSRPRVVFNDRLVLQRRNWTVGAEALPSRKPGETDASFYLRVNDWRESHGMPDQVFVFLTKDRGSDRKKDTKLTRDDYKPQFISFKNWFTIDLFERMRARASHSILIEEMLPTADSMLPMKGARHATELIVQWSPRMP
jgi:hypothetical protein